MKSAALPILPLQYPLIIFPGSRVTLPVKKALGQQLVTLMQESEAAPVVAAVPILNDESKTSEEYTLNSWGCVARITRLIRPSALNPSETFLVTLHGITRVRLPHTVQIVSNPPEELPYHQVEYLPPEGKAAKDTITTFKGAALNLLDRLVQDAGNNTRRENWARFSAMVEEVSDARAGWLADVMVWSMITDYSDRLGTCCICRTF